MSRSRNIKPGFFKNELLVGLPFEVRILFIGIWTMADRDGRLEDRPMKIRMEIFPADSVDVNVGLQSLHGAGFIERYEVEGTRYIQVLAWSKHQNPHCKESASILPARCKHGASTVQAPKLPDPARLIPDSLNLIPDSLKEKKPLEQQAARPTGRFAEFWEAYPVKKGKADAAKKWKAQKLDTIADQIIADVKARISGDRQWLDGYAPHGSTYVNGKGWEDAIEPPKASNTANGYRPMAGER